MGKTASNFSTSTSYSIGDLCLYNGFLYIFTSSHSAGAWNDNDVKEYDDRTEEEIEIILNGYKRAVGDVAFANAVVFDVSQIEGTRYKYVLTNAY